MQAASVSTASTSQGGTAWLVVAAAAAGYGTGGALMMNVLGLFILPMHDALGWSITAVTIAPIVSLVWALASPVAGHIIDRIGSRRAAIIGSITLAACLAGIAALPAYPASLYGSAVAMGLCCAFTSVPTYTKAVATWVRGNVGLAFGVTLSGSSLVAIGALPLAGWAIAQNGWRAGFAAVAALVTVVGLSAILLGFRERSVAAGRPETLAGADEGLAQVVKDVRFWLYAAAFGLACSAVGGFVGHLQPMLRLQGFSLATAVSLGMTYSIAISIGRIVGGMLLDRGPPFLIAATFLSLAGFGAFVLPLVPPGGSFAAPAVLVLLLGLGHGAEADFLAFFGLRSFGLKVYSAIVGVFAMISSLAVSVGIFLFGLIADYRDGYASACRIGGFCFLIAALLIALCGLVERRRVKGLAA